MKSIKTRVAAGATILGLGGLTGLALSASHQKAAQPVATKPLVRTKVIRRTVHVTRHARPKHPVGSAPGATGASTYAGTTATTGSSSVGSTASYEAAPVTTASSGASAVSPESAPVVTHTSGAGAGGSSTPVTTASSGGGGGGGGEHESEGGDD